MSILEIHSINKPAKKLIVLVHGLGSDGDDLLSLVPLVQKDLPEFHFYSPNGIEPYDMAPYGHQWFSLQDRSAAKILAGVVQSTPKFAEIIKLKQDQLNLSNKDTVLIGFSQGTMMSLYLNLIQEKPFAAVIGFSGLIVPPALPVNIKTPICLIHGENDNVININELTRTKEYLQQIGNEPEIYALDNLSHSIDARAIEIAVKFIQKHCEV